MKVQLIRHATILLEFRNKRILVDPMMSPKGTRSIIPTVKNGTWRKNPTKEISIDKAEVRKMFNSLDALLITHLHFDHFDEFGDIILPKSIPIICQIEDKRKLNKMGFNNLIPIEKNINFGDIQIKRTDCHHGGILIRKFMGKNSGFILQSENEPSVYITGDTIYCKHVEQGLDEKPNIIIANAGGAKLPFGRSITMNEIDVRKVCEYSKETEVIAVHMEAINHCILTRRELKNYLEKNKLLSRVKIPNDGEIYEYVKDIVKE